MKRIGTVSYNLYYNFTNYGSALSSWALHQVIKTLGYEPVLVDYCPDVLKDKDPLNPYKNMWDQDAEARRMVELSMPAIRINQEKFEKFFTEQFTRTSGKYTVGNYDSLKIEGLDGFICGSDTIFSPDEFGLDDGYLANYACMRGHSISYAASFGDPHFTEEDYKKLDECIRNFKALGIRENHMIPYLRERTAVPIKCVLDPTLLLDADEYSEIIERCDSKEPYLLLYARRYSPQMEAHAERIAKEHGWDIIDISLRATNAEKGHEMAYIAGIEEFLGLVKNAGYVVTNSYHGMIFSVIFKRPFVVFSREQCDRKITELLQILGLTGQMMYTGKEIIAEINYDKVHDVIRKEREESLRFLQMGLELL